MAYTVEAINEKKHEKMAKKHAQLAFFIVIFEVLCLSHITNCRIKKIARSVSKKEKSAFSRTFIFFLHEKKEDNGAQYQRNTLGSHD